MWLLNVYSAIKVRVHALSQNAVLYYSDYYYYVLNPWYSRRKGVFMYVSKYAAGIAQKLTFETKNVRFRYAGKAYRISKKKRILALTLHFPTYKYVIWRNIKLYHRRKKKKLFKFKVLTKSCLNPIFFFNMFKLRVPDTYTRRGILNNIFVYNGRKQKAATHR